ncbi:hypothetical protein FHS90_000335 [Rufibacter quisquiliarum]|uniref:Uncharacterized protein n=1 Tax=Rufibacter quisquiliarum TaxID=1549639 RepID=A0A839GMG5_9BACT|nr:hypothetical protein [Rufibacter quisquiliarum]
MMPKGWLPKVYPGGVHGAWRAVLIFAAFCPFKTRLIPQYENYEM